MKAGLYLINLTYFKKVTRRNRLYSRRKEFPLGLATLKSSETDLQQSGGIEETLVVVGNTGTGGVGEGSKTDGGIHLRNQKVTTFII